MIAKKYMDRLQRMIRDRDAREERLNLICGGRVAGSSRSSDWRDTEALRAAVAALSASQTKGEKE